MFVVCHYPSVFTWREKGVGSDRELGFTMFLKMNDEFENSMDELEMHTNRSLSFHTFLSDHLKGHFRHEMRDRN
jgi:hypothetical protein